MCARAARQPWRSRDTASLTTAKNQKSRTGENGGTSREPARVPNGGAPPQGEPHGGRVLGRIVARIATKRKIRAPARRSRPENGRPEAAVPASRGGSYLTSTEAPASSSCDLI